jgi:hypothetical protein
MLRGIVRSQRSAVRLQAVAGGGSERDRQRPQEKEQREATGAKGDRQTDTQLHPGSRGRLMLGPHRVPAYQEVNR